MLLALCILFAALAVAAAAAAYLAHRRARDAEERLEDSLGHLAASDIPIDVFEIFQKPRRFRLIRKSPNARPGFFANFGRCPCQSTYTVNTVQQRFANMPNQAQLNACLANPPPPRAEPWACPGNCVLVRTHVWSGWKLYRDVRLGGFLLNCNTYAQYHCKDPEDPARNDPPKTDPPDPPPEPPDVEA